MPDKLRQCTTSEEVHAMIRTLRSAGIETAQIPNGEFPPFYLYGFQDKERMESALADTILLVYDRSTAHIAVSSLYLQIDDSSGEYLLVR